MKRTLDLRTGRPVWYAYRAPSVAAGALTRDIRADVLVVGMGISGAMVAEALATKGRSVVCIDRRGPLKGSTAATTALVQFEIDQPLTVLAGKIGQARAAQAWRRSRLAIFNLKGRVEELGIRCDMASRPSLYLAGNVLAPGALRQEAQARNAVGIRATYLTAGMLSARFGIERSAALLSDDNLVVDPRRLAGGLLLAARDHGARFYAPVEAEMLESGRDHVSVTTGRGPTITAGHVVLATGYELMAAVPATRHRIVSTWAIATRPQKRALWPAEAMIWEASDPYLYARATADGRVVCGGEDEDFSDEARRDALISEKSAAISAKLTRLFPELDPGAEFAWAGAFGTTTTGLPIIGRLPGHPRVHAVLGYGGNGITYAQIASELIATELGGGTDADAALYAFDG